MQYAVFLLCVTARIAARHGGVVRPAWVEEEISSMPDAPAISRYKVRQLFREMKEDGLLHFDGNQYVWRETHALNYVGSDVYANGGAQ